MLGLEERRKLVEEFIKLITPGFEDEVSKSLEEFEPHGFYGSGAYDNQEYLENFVEVEVRVSTPEDNELKFIKVFYV